MKTTIGMILAIVVMSFMSVDDLTPRSTSQVSSQSRIEATSTDHQVVPSPKKPKTPNEPSAEKMTTR